MICVRATGCGDQTDWNRDCRPDDDVVDDPLDPSLDIYLERFYEMRAIAPDSPCRDRMRGLGLGGHPILDDGLGSRWQVALVQTSDDGLLEASILVIFGYVRCLAPVDRLP